MDELGPRSALVGPSCHPLSYHVPGKSRQPQRDFLLLTLGAAAPVNHFPFLNGGGRLIDRKTKWRHVPQATFGGTCSPGETFRKPPRKGFDNNKAISNLILFCPAAAAL